MKRRRPASTSAGPAGDLTQLIRRSRLLDPIAKRHWLKLLPHLTPSDRARLEEILLAEADPSDQ